MKKLFLLAVLTAFAVPAFAQTPVPAPAPVTYPFFDLHRLSVAAGIDHSWYASDTLTPISQEWKYGGSLAYKLVPHLSLDAGLSYGQDTHQVEEKAGLRLTIYNGGQ